MRSFQHVLVRRVHIDLMRFSGALCRTVR
ncbi:putative leader peptide [Yinghuangia sp. ASG 101]